MEDPNILLESINTDLQLYKKTSLSLKNNLKLLFFNQNYDIDKLYNLFTNSPDELKNVINSQSNITSIEKQLNEICDKYEIEHFDYILWDTVSEEYIYYYEFYLTFQQIPNWLYE